MNAWGKLMHWLIVEPALKVELEIAKQEAFERMTGISELTRESTLLATVSTFEDSIPLSDKIELRRNALGSSSGQVG